MPRSLHRTQGVILFKHHDPLAFSLEQLADLVDVSHAWFRRAAGEEAARDAALGLPPRTLHPLLVWNCLPRAGASQARAGVLERAAGLDALPRLGLLSGRRAESLVPSAPTPLPSSGPTSLPRPAAAHSSTPTPGCC